MVIINYTCIHLLTKFVEVANGMQQSGKRQSIKGISTFIAGYTWHEIGSKISVEFFVSSTISTTSLAKLYSIYVSTSREAFFHL